MIITGNALISVEEKDIVDGVLQIPEGIITIEKFACSGCQERIKKNVFPSSVKKIKKYAFLRTAIRDLIIPESVEEIEEEAFMECRDLKYILAVQRAVYGKLYVSGLSKPVRGSFSRWYENDWASSLYELQKIKESISSRQYRVVRFWRFLWL